ncbi:hypothetical protein SAMN02745883_01847 [Caminicella sporogenes DSM 14501]|uniref:DUF2325 domain-containing protein n=1 Tax=Caminicella sporogenes DSM 14501 TaxID=1121266 RepID=A0A1M6RQD5_9FIRM|nr:DUF2325 domain-containing protein [Caminicella sporogenes]RKD23678.1 hypothetical protein BET04_04590 [Caminicella sporogenes]WIF94020.1 DUF2325 domain-containing protein [Caminicella sporogenes]SHK34653.1 hypothetical protein SAMN02745883_01847 [Caminicella sporogenes DSM 14501]
MSVVIVGGHERMERIYKNTGKKYGCKVKVFTKMQRDFHKRIGNPDYIVVFTDVISHKLVDVTLRISKKKNIPNLRLHNSSLKTLEKVLQQIIVN